MTDVAKGLNAKGGKNTHRFQTKADRVASVRVDVSRRIERTSGIGTNAGAVPDAGEHGSFFFDELERMRHLYATPQYMAFYREVHPRALTMALLLHHRADIVDALLRHLQRGGDAPQVGPLLDLVGTLARDLRQHFMPFFGRVLAVVLRMVSDEDEGEGGGGGGEPASPERVGEVFRAVGLLFKYLSKPLRKDMAKLRQFYAPMLGHRKDFVRRFAAETVAPLLRKLSDEALHKHVRGLLKAVGRELPGEPTASSPPPGGEHSAVARPAVDVAADVGLDEPDGEDESDDEARRRAPRDAAATPRGADTAQSLVVDGLAQLLFNLMKGVRNQLHSRASALLRALLQSLSVRPAHKSRGKGKGKQSQAKGVVSPRALEAVRGALHHVCEFTRAQHCEAVWKELFAALDGAVAAWSGLGLEAPSEDVDAAATWLRWLISVLQMWVEHRGGSRVGAARHAPLIALLTQLTAPPIAHGPHATSAQGLDLTRAVTDTVLCCVGADWKGPLLAPGTHLQAAQTSVMALLESTFDVGPHMHSVDRCACVVNASRKLLDGLGGDYGNARSFIPLALGFCGRLLWHESEIITSSSGKNRRAGRRSRSRSRSCDGLEVQGDVASAHCTFAYVLLADIANAARAVTGEFGGGALPDVTADGLLRLPRVRAQDNKPSPASMLLQAVRCDSSSQPADAAKLWCALRCVEHVDVGVRGGTGDVVQPAEWFEAVQHAADALERRGGAGDGDDGSLLVGQSYATLLALLCRQRSDTEPSKRFCSLCARIERALQRNPASLPMIAVADSFVEEVARSHFDRVFDDSRQRKWADMLQSSLSSRSRRVRSHAIKILARFPPLQWTRDDEQCDCPVIQLCAEIGGLEISLDTERDFTRRLQTLDVLSRTPSLPPTYARLLAHFLLGLLHNKFSTIWTHATAGLATLLESHAAVVWPILMAKLRQVESQLEQPASKSTDAPEECAMARSLADAAAFARFDASKMEQQADADLGTDDDMFHQELWKLLCLNHVPHLVAQRSTEVVQVFFRFLRRQYFVIHTDHLELDTLDLGCDADDSQISTLPRPANVQNRLKRYLGLFAAIKNGKGLHEQRRLERVFVAFLTHADWTVAKLCAQALLHTKAAHLTPYRDHLLDISEPAKFREALLRFPLGRDAGILAHAHRADALPIIMRLLYGKLTARHVGGGKKPQSPSARRATVLAHMASCDDDELTFLMKLVLRPFHFEAASVTVSRTTYRKMKGSVVAGVAATRQIGFLRLATDMVKHMHTKLHQYLHTLTAIVAALLHNVVAQLESISDAISRDDVRQYVMVRGLCFRCASELLSQFPEHDFGCWAADFLPALMHDGMRLPSVMKGAQQPSALLLCMKDLCDRTELVPAVHQHTPQFLPIVLQCLSTRVEAGKNVVECALGVLEGALRHDETASRKADRVLMGLLPDVLSQFCELFERGENDMAKGGRAAYERAREREGHLQFLVRASRFCADLDVEKVSESATLLANLLLQHIHPRARPRDTTAKHVLGIFEELVPLTRSPETYVLPLAQLFGPRGLSSQTPRRALCSSFRVVVCSDGMVGQGWDALAKTLDEMNAFVTGGLEDKADMSTRLDAIDRLNDGEMEHFVLDVTPSQLRMQLSPLVQQLLHYLHDDELALRNNGAHILEKMLELFGGAISQRDAKTNQLKKAKISSKERRSDELSGLMCDLVVPAIHFGIKSHSATTRRSFVTLLATTIRLFPSFTQFHGDLACLCDVHDPESDFFNNIVHLQLHRRRRALARLRKLCEAAARGETTMPLAQSSVVHILIPLVQHFIYELQKTTEQTTQDEAVHTFGALAGHMSWKPYSRSLLTMIKQIPRHPEQERSLVKAVCAMIDSFPLRLPDADEAETEARSETEPEVTSDMDATTVEQLPPEHDGVDADDKKSEGEGESEDESDSEGESESEDESAADALRAKSTLAKKVVPMLRRFMVQSKRLNDGTWRNTIRPHVALATVKCLRLLGGDKLGSELPQLLKRVCDSLRSRDEQQRSSGHDAMVMMAAELGARHLLKILVALQNGLLAGYQVHVLSHTLHSILLRLSDTDEPETDSSERKTPTQDTEIKVNPAFESGLQACLPPILGILMEDVFGDAGAQKQEEHFKKKVKIKESKGCRSYDSFELLAQTIQFLPNASLYMLLEPVLQHISQGRDSKGIGKAQEVLRRVAVGLLHNHSVDIETLLIYIYTLIKHHIGIGRNKAEGDNKAGGSRPRSDGSNAVVPWMLSDPSSRTSQSMRALDASLRQFQGLVQMAGVVQNMSTSNAAMGKTLKAASAGGSNSAMLDSTMLHFALQLLHARLKRKIISGKDSAHLRMMEPFVPLLVAMMRRTKVARVQLLVLQCVQHTLHWPLPSWDSQLKALTARVFDLLKPDSVASPELVQGAIKLLAAMLQRCEQLDLAMPQVRLLLSRIAVEIDGHGGGAGTAQNASFALLKAVVQRRFVVPEVYDLMDIVGRLLVTSDRAVVQQHCSGLFWRFLLEYPLSDRRVDRQLQYLLRNMSFEYEGGRRAVLGCLQSVVEKFPVAVLESRAQLLFMRLSLQLVQDETSDCRQAAARALRTVLKRVSVGTVHESVAIVTEWLNADEGEVFRTGVQVAGQIVEARPDTLKRWVPAFISAVHAGLERAAADDDAWDEAEEVTGEQGTSARWQPVYYSLLLLEKLMSHASSTVCALLDGVVGAGTPENESQRAASSILPALSESCLLHEHFWVRIASSRIIGVYFAQHSPKAATDREPQRQQSAFLAADNALPTLAKHFCLQLQSKFLDDRFAEQVIKNLLFVTRAMHRDTMASAGGDDAEGGEDDYERGAVARGVAVEANDEEEDEDEDGDGGAEETEAARIMIEHDPLRWLFRRMSKLATAKGRTDRDCQRCAVFKWFAAVATQCDKRLTLRFLAAMLEPLQRSTTYENERENVKDLAQEVMALLEQRVTELAGATAFGNAYAAVQQQAATKRAARKRERALEAVMDPGAAATRKRRKHQAGAERRKRKIEQFRSRDGRGGPGAGRKRHVQQR